MSTSPVPVAEARSWVTAGTVVFERLIAGVDDLALAEPSLLPGWSRAHVVAHLVGNAEGLSNLCTWVQTGVETPMYASTDQRNADIESRSSLGSSELRALFVDTSAALDRGWGAMDEAMWEREVRNAQGRAIAVSLIPSMRARELFVHGYDLDCGLTFDEFPEGLLLWTIEDVVARRSTMADHPALVLRSHGRTWMVEGEGAPAEVEGTLGEIAGYLTGRFALHPPIPPWL